MAKYHDRYGSLEYPPQWGSEVAWGVLRRSIVNAYWLRVEELQLLAACCCTGVYVYRFDVGEAAESVDAYNCVSIGEDLYLDLPEMDELVP